MTGAEIFENVDKALKLGKDVRKDWASGVKGKAKVIGKASLPAAAVGGLVYGAKKLHEKD